MSNLEYDELKLQHYLYDPGTSIDEKILTFKWRTSMTNGFGENYRGGEAVTVCPFCDEHIDSQKEAFNNCSFIQKHIEIHGKYEEIFSEYVPKTVISSITKITNLRKN